MGTRRLRRNRALRWLAGRLVGVGARVAVGLGRRLPERLVERWFVAAAALAWRVSGRHRRRAEEHLSFAYPDLDGAAIRERSRAVYRHFARMGADVLKVMRRGREALDQMVEPNPEGLRRIEAACERGRGLLIVTGHIGSWELLAAYIVSRFPGGGVVVRRQRNPTINRIAEEIRTGFGLRVLYREEESREIVRHLREGRILGIVADQDIPDVEGIFVDFLGRPAYTPTGPAALSRLTGAPLLAAFLIRRPEGTYRFLVRDPLWPSGAPDGDEEMTKVWSSQVEEMVRLHPEQWVWMHRRWRTDAARLERARRRRARRLRSGASRHQAPGSSSGAAD